MIEINYLLQEIKEIKKGLDAMEEHIRIADYSQVEVERNLSVPFVSQLGPGADKYHNDCGAASACMIIKAFHPEDGVTPNKFYKLTGQKKDAYLSVGSIRDVLYDNFRIATNWEFGDRVVTNINNNLLMIALINYVSLQDWKKNPYSGFRGQHFVVVVGYGTNHYRILDPLFDAPSGIFVPHAVFTEAWQKAVPAMGAIVTAAPVGIDIEAISNYEIITPYGVNVRKSPDVSSEILGALSQGRVVQVYETTEVHGGRKMNETWWGRIGKDRWFAIKYDGERLATTKYG